MKTLVVIGLGRFGNAVTTELSSLGHEVLAVDEREDHVQGVAEKVTHAVTDDARDPLALRALDVCNYDYAAVAMEDDIGSSAPITLNLKRIRIKRVIYEAQSYVHRKVLEKIRADRVIFSEHEMGIKLAQGLSSSNVLNFTGLSEGFGIVETTVPKEWRHEAIQNLDVRVRYKVNVIAMRRSRGGTLSVAPGASYVIEPGDAVAALDRTEDINHLQDL